MGERRPNVLLIMCDQFRYDAIRAHGNDAIETPALDRLMASGISFDRAYTESPVCVPARAAALTGLLPHRTGVTDNPVPLAADAPTFASALSDVGYFCQAIGKMHFRPPRTQHGFHRLLLSEEIPGNVADDDYLTELAAAGRTDVLEPHGVRHELYYSPQPSQLPEPLTTTAWTGRKTVEFLASRHDSDPPFLCWTSFIKPHPPFDPPAPWYLQYDPLRMPDPIRSEEERGRLLHQIHVQHRSKWTSPDLELNRIRTIRAYYYALVSHVDHWIGRILDELERTGLRENTLVIFTADHGEYLGDHWAFGKRGFHDAAARIPYLWSWPGAIPAGARSDALVGLADLAPTLAAVGGSSAPSADGDGANILPLAQNAGRAVRDHAIGQFSHGRTGLYLSMDTRHKYVYSAADDAELLLAVGMPDGETRNLADDPAYQEVVDRLRASIVRRFASDGYTEPLEGDGWRKYPREPDLLDRDDRQPEGRGRQYPRWPAPDRRHPPDLIGKPT